MTRAAPRAASRAADGAVQPSDEQADRAFSRHAGGRARRRRTTRSAAYRRDLADFRRLPRRRRQLPSSRATPRICARYLGAAGAARIAAGDGGAPALGDPPALPLPLRRRPAQGRSRRRARRPEARPPAAEDAQPRRGRSAAARRRHGAIRRRRLRERLRAARLACLLELLYATGLRVSELVALPIPAARRDARVVVVRGKGNKERLVPLNDAAKRAMAEYLALRAEAEGGGGAVVAARSKWLFPSFGEQRPSHPPALRPRAQGARGRRRIASGAGEPARAAPRLRQPPPAQRRRPARGADAAWPRRHFHHPDLHPRPRRAPEKPGARSASVGG